MIQYSKEVETFLSALIHAYHDRPAHECLLDGISCGLAISAHKPKFAGQLLEEISINKVNWKVMVDDFVAIADACDQS